jgi:hypothetical protein
MVPLKRLRQTPSDSGSRYEEVKDDVYNLVPEIDTMQSEAYWRALQAEMEAENAKREAFMSKYKWSIEDFTFFEKLVPI